ncbi:uncharacterized protein LOC6637696 [Drosophila willistoni]|uniref:uncharacterized protein LOC6637696 n=1 Tax=Drosophila willistoni TaxID=7260 RepID=UPI001F084ABE|nr:uncharacterized protein LOC6637696 [Drosophila willistoni]
MFVAMHLKDPIIWMFNVSSSPLRQTQGPNAPSAALAASSSFSLEGTTEANTRTQCSPQPLWLQAARSVDQFKLPIYSLPAILIKLIAETPKCVCGKFCFLMDSLNIYKRIRSAKFERIKNYSYSPDQFIYVDIVKWLL